MLCVQCKNEFTPKPKGYNARYCTDKCKRRNQRARLIKNNPDQLKNARKRSYAQTKSNIDRYENHLTSVRNSAKKPREWLKEYKLFHGCIDCGYKEHFAALQLDHTGKKSIEIADARGSIARLRTEIEDGECVVRCANCHSIKTWRDKQNHEKT